MLCESVVACVLHGLFDTSSCIYPACPLMYPLACIPALVSPLWFCISQARARGFACAFSNEAVGSPWLSAIGSGKRMSITLYLQKALSETVTGRMAHSDREDKQGWHGLPELPELAPDAFCDPRDWL